MSEGSRSGFEKSRRLRRGAVETILGGLNVQGKCPSPISSGLA